MANIVFMKGADVPKEGSTAVAVVNFLAKLADDDTLPGLKVKPLNNMVDSRMRTARVNNKLRAVLVKLAGSSEPTYVFVGVYEHDKANKLAQRSRLNINAVTGVPELIENIPETGAPTHTETEAPVDYEQHWATDSPRDLKPIPPSGSQPHYPLLETAGYTVESLIEYGIGETIAKRAMAIDNETELLHYAGSLTPQWKGLFLVDIATGRTPQESLEDLDLGEGNAPLPADAHHPTDEEILRSLEHPASLLDFTKIQKGEQGMTELAAVLEEGSFADWRVFLHPQQRAYANRDRNGAFRLSGGAGTGKTVVLVHRLRVLHQKNPDARIVLTTFGRTLADSLKEQITTLDSSIPQVELGQAGACIKGVDALVHRVLSQAGEKLTAHSDGENNPITRVLGSQRSANILGLTEDSMWREVAESLALPERFNPEFLKQEYELVILPNRITEEAQYLRIPRPGRGQRLSRAERRQVWEAVRNYRARCGFAGTTDWDEKAMIAATYLDAQVAKGHRRPADHVLVDETQDLSPSHLHFLRALVSEGKNDLFLADDAHQRIYVPKVVLSHYGINIRGRSRRLTLNYRTTAQNLAYALGVLSGVEYTDLSGDEVSATGYRSIRTGAEPILVGCADKIEEFDAVAKHINTWCKERNPSVGVLCGSNREAETWVQALADRGVQATLVGRDTPLSDNDVGVMTRHRAKGMEFTHVAMVGLGEGARFPGAETGDDAPQTRERSLVYVGATRARDALLVSWVGQPHPVLGEVG